MGGMLSFAGISGKGSGIAAFMVVSRGPFPVPVS
jgi:hypothetical protein